MITEGLVSIIIPAYNCEDHLNNSLSSILIQTYKCFEVIIINDGSTDNSKDIIKKFISENSEFKIKYFENPKNIGQAASLNIGLDNSVGEFVCFIDADDKISSNFLYLLKERMQNSLDFVYCGFDIINTINGKIIKYEQKRKYLQHSDNIINQYLHATNHFSFVGAMYKKVFLEQHKIRFNEANRYGCDIEFLCNLFLKKPNSGCVPQSLYYYLIRPDSVSTDTECPYIFHCVEGMLRIQRKLPTLREKLMFAISRKANMIYHVIHELYDKKTKKKVAFKTKFNYTLLFIMQVFNRPKERLTTESMRALAYFLK